MLPDLIGIVMMQYGSEEFALRCRHHGVAESMTKPFRMEEFIVIVNGVLAMHEHRGPMPAGLAAELHAALGLRPRHAKPAPPNQCRVSARRTGFDRCGPVATIA